MAADTKTLELALELAEMLRPGWADRHAALRASGTPLNDGGDGAGGGEGSGTGDATGGGATPPAAGEMPEGAKKALDAARQEAREATKRAKAAEAKAKEYEDRDKTETQKLADEKTAAQADAASARAELLRYEIAAEKGLTTAQAKRLVGTTKDELLKDADVLLADLKPAAATEFDGGARTAAKSGGMDDLIRQQLRR